jgi:hypothetical protein
MEQLKFSLGPYEIFSSIIGGSPLVLAMYLVYHPSQNLQDIFLAIRSNLTLPMVFLIVFFSYLLGGAIQGITWKYFLFLCNIFDLDYRYFRNIILQKDSLLAQTDVDREASGLEFEDKLVLMLREKVSIPKNIAWLDARLLSYLKEHQSQAAITAESHQANHIMYRNLSFGFLILSILLLINLIRLKLFGFEILFFIFLSISISYITFFRSLSFKRWHNRELLLGFYFSASNEMR